MPISTEPSKPIPSNKVAAPALKSTPLSDDLDPNAVADFESEIPQAQVLPAAVLAGKERKMTDVK